MTLARGLLSTVALFVLVACGNDDEDEESYDCRDYCADVASCPDAQVTDCSQLCDHVASLEEKSGCSDAWGAWVGCNGQNRDEVCSETPETCLTQGLALYSCVQAYCSVNDGDPDCAALLAFLQ